MADVEPARSSVYDRRVDEQRAQRTGLGPEKRAVPFGAIVLGGAGVAIAGLVQLISSGSSAVWVGLAMAGGAFYSLARETTRDPARETALASVGHAPHAAASPETSPEIDAALGQVGRAGDDEPVSAQILRASDASFARRYELLEKLGAGHMGEVWRARQAGLGRMCAIKTLLPEQAGEAQLRRFMREARVTAGLLSPHTVQIYDFGEQSNGSIFYVMELLDGTDLQSLVKKTGAMSAERVVNVLLQACHSLEEAHRAGLVHRDLKPANLMLCRYGLERDFLKVVDFGLAKDNAAADDGVKLTAQRTVLGTAAYLAPESMKGSANVDGRADIYALGCIAFWLLTGELLFKHDSPMKMVQAHVSETPRRVAQLQPQVPAGLDAIIASCLEKSPAARPQSAEELAVRLSALGLAEQWTDADAAAWWRHHADRVSA